MNFGIEGYWFWMTISFIEDHWLALGAGVVVETWMITVAFCLRH